ncbi:nanoRNase/pAp phosphatase (c-di-AMP/oligoRNAs hydrolase) [Hypnocyclicus thermotrophus]|uniref:NanoRNase/pAp phosphatase (C-di-AMP/oligoRNAs hydrolase) n=1 Tax=Hypnocyclicus thermotrophus TaxID=1627895 RepID=A0AA46DZL6_9FUSO|nr:exopolyphosphatase [Hypnocyclicus thermotrophus]TDT71903.1 nanoRNase/pAp phosphatase (c-di-AMP/oligoRNAs hydrolase) [Hypnocyclicus thermotrophus]
MSHYRLVTRSDMDGLVCAVLLKELDMIDDIKFVHPKDMQDGIIEITENDIITNLPYAEKAHLVFDHHLSETIRNKGKKPNHIIDPDAPSASRVVYDYFGGKKVFKNISEDMMIAVDKADAARFNKEDVLNPKGWELLSFLMDARTGLGRFRDFTISNYNLMMNLIDYCKDHSIEEILELPDVKERVDLYFKYENDFKEQLKKCSTLYNNVLVVDLREEEIIYPGNRFMKYALFPEANISIQVIWGLRKQNTVFAVGKSIFNRTSEKNIGELMLKRDGGGHKAAGTCQVNNEIAEEELKKLIEELKD